MKNTINSITLKALAAVATSPDIIFKVIDRVAGTKYKSDQKLPLWIKQEEWEEMVEAIKLDETITNGHFKQAGLKCLDLGLMGPISYLHLFIGSPALLFHNIGSLLSALDTFTSVGRIFVGDQKCLFEITSNYSDHIPVEYLEFVCGYCQAAATLWNCTVTEARVLSEANNTTAAISFTWNITELHNRRALEELLIEREFFNEMYDGLKRISESHDEFFSPLLEQNVKMKQRLLDTGTTKPSYNNSSYTQTRLYDGFLGLDADLNIISISNSALDLLDYKDKADFLEKNRKLKHLLVRDSISSQELLNQLNNSRLSSRIYNVLNGHGMYQEVDLSLSSHFALEDDEEYRLVLRDVTLAKKLNLPLEPTRQVLDALFTNNPAALQIIDPRGQTTKVNRQFEDLFGVSAADFIGESTYNVLKDEDLRDCGLLAMLEKVFSTSERISKTIILGENRNYKNTLLAGITEMLVLEVTIFPLSSSADQLNSVIISYTDITDTFLSQQQLAQTDKLRSIGTLTSGIAHDFNNILGAIVPNADFIMSQVEDNELIHRKARAIKSASKRASELMRQLMTYARQSKLNKQRLEFNTCIGEALELIQNAIPKSIAISFEKELEDSSEILADPLQMQQLLINLIINAADAQPEGGHIIVQTRKFELRQRITFAGNIVGAGTYVCVSIQDNGNGMTKDVIERVFDPFFTTKEKGRGTGLGLSVVHGIVKNHQGYIDIQSEQNMGTTFLVYLPLAPVEN